MPTMFDLDQKPQFLTPPDGEVLRIHNVGGGTIQYVPDPGNDKRPVFRPELVSTLVPKDELTIAGPTWLHAPNATRVLILDGDTE
jgi:hypothetical protein